MKNLLYILLFFGGLNISAQQTYDDGWDDGFEAAYQEQNLFVPITPISPIVGINETDTYRTGYRKGYNRGLKDIEESNANSNSTNSWRQSHAEAQIIISNDPEGSYDDGWDEGFEAAYQDNNLVAPIPPISPIVGINEVENYATGYRKGYNRALKDIEEDNQNSINANNPQVTPNSIRISIPISSEKTYDEGWDEGFEAAYQDYDLAVPISPISPIVGIYEIENYRTGFSKGYNRALNDIHNANQINSRSNDEIIIPLPINVEGDFDDGWDAGYSDAMNDNNEAIFIIPISPIVGINESDTYGSGYRRGYNKGLKDLE